MKWLEGGKKVRNADHVPDTGWVKASFSGAKVELARADRTVESEILRHKKDQGKNFQDTRGKISGSPAQGVQ